MSVVEVISSINYKGREGLGRVERSRGFTATFEERRSSGLYCHL
jgi:hypothetical protein